MEWKDTDSDACPIAAAMTVLGDKWTLLILRDAFNGIRRFDDFKQHLGVSRPLLSGRLKKLTAAGVLIRNPYQTPGERKRYEYRLTEKARELQLVMVALGEWGGKYAGLPTNPSTTIVERGSGEEVTLRLTRRSDGAFVDPRTVGIRIHDKIVGS